MRNGGIFEGILKIILGELLEGVSGRFSAETAEGLLGGILEKVFEEDSESIIERYINYIFGRISKSIGDFLGKVFEEVLGDYARRVLGGILKYVFVFAFNP